MARGVGGDHYSAQGVPHEQGLVLGRERSDQRMDVGGERLRVVWRHARGLSVTAQVDANGAEALGQGHPVPEVTVLCQPVNGDQEGSCSFLVVSQGHDVAHGRDARPRPWHDFERDP